MKWAWRQEKELCHLVLPEWSNHGVVTAFTTKMGGSSIGPYQSLNMGLHVEDQDQAVLANREKVALSLGIHSCQMVCAEQIHSNRVAVVTGKDSGRGTTSYRDSLPGIDAMITNQPGIFLTAFFADCIPIFLFDPQKGAVGLVHSGWKGTALRIAEGTIRAMEINFGCRPQDIQAFIGPGIGPECFRVDSQRYQVAKKAFAWDEQVVYPDEENQYKWDLPLTNELIIREVGVPQENITSCQMCTACNQEWFFSFRGAGGNTGRMAAVLGLRD